MNSFLYVLVAGVPVIIDGSAVEEVLSLSEDKDKIDTSLGYLNWRNQVIPIVAARELLMLPVFPTDKNLAGIVFCIEPGGKPILLLVSEVLQVLKIAQEDFVPLPRVPEKTLHYFDRIYQDSTKNRQAYRLRNPLPEGVLKDIAGMTAVRCC